MHIKDNKNGKEVNFSFSKIWWASKVSLLAIENDCVARSYRFSVPLTCTRAIIGASTSEPHSQASNLASVTRDIDRRVVTFLWASPVWRQTGQAQKNGAHWLRSGTTCTSTRFFAKYTHFAIVFAGSAERGTLLLWNGGWSIRLVALEEELRLSKVEEKCTVAEVLTKAIRYACTTSLAHTPPSLSVTVR